MFDVHEAVTAAPAAAHPYTHAGGGGGGGGAARTARSSRRRTAAGRAAGGAADNGGDGDGDDDDEVMLPVSSSSDDPDADSDYLEGPAPLRRRRSRFGQDGLTRQQRAEQRRQRMVLDEDAMSEASSPRRPARGRSRASNAVGRSDRPRRNRAERSYVVPGSDSEFTGVSDSSSDESPCVC